MDKKHVKQFVSMPLEQVWSSNEKKGHAKVKSKKGKQKLSKKLNAKIEIKNIKNRESKIAT